jgi:serine/threonine-protein kinase
LIESGGQGVILLATKHNSPPLVLKVANVLTDNLKETDIAYHRIKREGDILLELISRHCKDVPVLRYLDPEGRFLIRDYCPGCTLQEAVLRLFPEERAALLPELMSFCRRLAYVFHRSGPNTFVIRDFKPKNLIIDISNSSQLMLIDVGSARISGHRPKTPQSKIRMGTRNWLYWSPELLLSQGLQADEKSDYFSFGATAFYLITGHSPFSNSEPNSSLFLHQYMIEYETVINEWHAACSSLYVPIQIESLISTWLHPLPEHRITCIAET